jgi:hypothetical protein
LVKRGVLLAAALLLVAPEAPAGPHVVAGRQTPQPQPAPAAVPVPVVRAAPQSLVLSVVVTPPQPAAEPLTVDLRGPDGQVRRFVVEGGLDAIQYAPVVLRPGQSVTLRWPAAR